jgi:hypothetical protein
MSHYSEEVTELLLSIENNGDLYYKYRHPIQRMLDKKVMAHTYDSKLAPKAFTKMVDEGAYEYFRLGRRATASERAGYLKEARKTFTSATRKKVVDALVFRYEMGLKERGLSIDKDGHLCTACAAKAKY